MAARPQKPRLRQDCATAISPVAFTRGSWREAAVSQANRKQLRWTVHSDLNRLPTAGRLWCAYVALRVFVDCYRPIAAALIEQAGSSALYMTGAATGAR